jgi:hypothetical protein
VAKAGGRRGRSIPLVEVVGSPARDQASSRPRVKGRLRFAEHLGTASGPASRFRRRHGLPDAFFWKAYLTIEGTLNGNRPSWSIDPEPAQPLRQHRALRPKSLLKCAPVRRNSLRQLTMQPQRMQLQVGAEAAADSTAPFEPSSCLFKRGYGCS